MTLELEVIDINVTMADVLKVFLRLPEKLRPTCPQYPKVLNQSLALKLANDIMIRPDRFHDVKVKNVEFSLIVTSSQRWSSATGRRRHELTTMRQCVGKFKSLLMRSKKTISKNRVICEICLLSTKTSKSHSQMLGKFEYTLPAKFWRLVGCTEMLSW